MNTQTSVLDKVDIHGIFALMAQAMRLPMAALENSRVNEASPAARNGLFDRLDRWMWKRHQQAVEAYVGQAEDLNDVERRIRAIERGMPSSFY